MAPVIQIPPHHYIHVLDQNTNVTRLETGPLNYIHQNRERVLFSPKRMITVPPRHYCVVANPVARDDKGQVLFDKSGQAKLRYGDQETRLTQDPFPLYPGEKIQQDVTLLLTVAAGTGLRLKALLDFEDDGGQKRAAGDEWLFKGPGTYIPRKEVKVVETMKDPEEVKRILKVAGAVTGIAVGAVGAVALAPVALAAVGFTSAGIASGSIAAGMMSSAAIANGGGVAAGSLVAILQSAGAVGLSASASAAVASAGAAVGGAIGGAAGWLTGVFRKKKE